jgi:hypothetical protein
MAPPVGPVFRPPKPLGPPTVKTALVKVKFEFAKAPVAPVTVKTAPTVAVDP